MSLFEYLVVGFSCFSLIIFVPKTVFYVLSLITRPCRKKILKAQLNDWAIITGSTDGIGLEYARQLAEKGFNILLLSRSQSKLSKVQSEIAETSHVDVEILAVDFTEIDIYQNIKRKIDELDGQIAVLVNNVGTSSSHPYEFANHEDHNMNANVVICNVYPVTKMCEMILPIMKNQKRGIVINVSSSISLVPVPYFATYAATKSFVSTLSQCLSVEYSKYGITVQDVIPNQVVTKLSKDVSIPILRVEAKSFVKYALKTVGKERKTSAHPKHKLLNNMFAFMGYWLPESLVMSITKRSAQNMLRRHESNNNDS